MGHQIQPKVLFRWRDVSGLQRGPACRQGEKNGLINAISMFVAIVVVVVVGGGGGGVGGVVVVVKKLQGDFKSLPRSLATLERAKKTWNCSRCCSLLPMNTGVHHLSYGCTMDMDGPC